MSVDVLIIGHHKIDQELVATAVEGAKTGIIRGQ
jgi:hypothetical protein